MINKENVILIKNPSAKSGKGRNNWKFFDKFEGIITTSRENAIETVKNTNKRIIAAVGGDGTINQCVNGIMKSKEDKILAVLYSGTSPDFNRFHNIPVNPEKALETLENGEIKEVDVCLIKDEAENEFWFSSSCNIGLGVRVAGTSNKIRRYFGDFLGTFLALLYAILTSKPFAANIKTEEKTLELKKLLHLFIIKNNYIASGLKMNINNTPDNGLIYLAAIKNNGIKNLLKNIVSLYKGEIPKDIIIEKCTEVYIETNPKQYIEFDGDAYYEITTPVKAECRRKALKIIK